MRHTKQIGISLLEVMLSLSVIAIILVMATRYFFVATNNNKINTAISQIGALVGAAHTWKGIKSDYTNVSIQELYNAGQLENFPGLDDSAPSAVTLKDMWGNSFVIEPGPNSNAIITLTLPTAGNCGALQNAYKNSSCSGTAFTYTFS